MNEYSIQENIVNIAMRAAELLKDGKIERDDIDGHVGMTQTIVQLAKEFELQHADEDWELPFSPDYWEEIDKFAEEKLMERYSIEPKENTVKLWARVGMTLEVPAETYEQLKVGDRAALQAVFDGTAGHARLDGETYFPDLEQNAGLEEMEFDLPVSRTKQAKLDTPLWDMDDPAKVYAVAGSVKHQVYSGTIEGCERFCQDNNWTYLDENEFEWNLEIEEQEHVLSTPEGPGLDIKILSLQACSDEDYGNTVVQYQQGDAVSFAFSAVPTEEAMKDPQKVIEEIQTERAGKPGLPSWADLSKPLLGIILENPFDMHFEEYDDEGSSKDLEETYWDEVCRLGIDDTVRCGEDDALVTVYAGAMGSIDWSGHELWGKPFFEHRFENNTLVTGGKPSLNDQIKAAQTTAEKQQTGNGLCPDQRGPQR